VQTPTFDGILDFGAFPLKGLFAVESHDEVADLEIHH